MKSLQRWHGPNWQIAAACFANSCIAAFLLLSTPGDTASESDTAWLVLRRATTRSHSRRTHIGGIGNDMHFFVGHAGTALVPGGHAKQSCATCVNREDGLRSGVPMWAGVAAAACIVSAVAASAPERRQRVFGECPKRKAQHCRNSKDRKITRCSHEHGHEEAHSHGNDCDGHSHEDGQDCDHGDGHESDHGHNGDAHEHGEDCDHGHDHESDHGHVCEHEHGHGHKEESCHSHGHKEEEHSHDSHSHSHAESSHSHDSNGHGHEDGHGGLGHGHSHGEVPDWLPYSSKLRRATKWAKSGPVMAVVSTIYLVSLLPWKATLPRLLGSPVVFAVLGIPALLEALGTLGELDVHFLMTLAAFASVAIGHSHEGAALLLLFALSQWVEDQLSMSARASLDALSRMTPENAHRVPEESESLASVEDSIDTPSSTLRTGDRIIVRAGEVVPVDAEVIDGTSQVRLDHLTGEPLPIAVAQGDEVMSGALSVDGALLLRVLRPADESTIQKIGRLTTTASASRPQLVTFLDAVAKRWSVAVVISTAVIAIVPPLLFHAPVGPSLYRSLVWLITASPCALILAAPLVYVSGLSVCFSNGVLLKGGRVLDALANANGFAFDKTGTLTTGSATLLRIEELSKDSNARNIASPSSRTRALAAAGSLGRLSVHPISQALAAAAPPEGALEVVEYNMVAGSGVTGIMSFVGEEGVRWEAALGRPAFVSAHLEAGGAAGSALAAVVRGAAGGEDAGGSAVKGESGCVVTALGLRPAKGATGDGAGAAPVAWLLHLQDRVKTSAQEVLEEMAGRGPVYMLTGDCLANAKSVSTQVGPHFTAVYADLRPEDKFAKVRELDEHLKEPSKNGTSIRERIVRALGASSGGLVMVGDGVNDAPALAAATAGISLANSTDGALSTTAVEGSDVLVLRQARDVDGDEDLLRVAWVMHVARAARQLVQQNVFMALFSIGGASVLTLVSDIPLWLGVVLHEGTTVLVALNSLRLFSKLRGSKWGLERPGAVVPTRRRRRA